ncbi:membrane protein insertion efficiency factor YidD [Paramagnetospirillum kuznetsovii]|uniref:Putative membrane protein insertion efficiency factor n=1 Tax=Paramagnetospirillum kuznetsovii TaxID=2053833 RepID=A0A364P3L8_9PROT|nr:membrane protein insertion efficiency factor YidD [Paramagnetospirillum kuznetsovii]RAU23886.1 membrane protein insertion efficiency factor YidD [Paramagnetospirillum kuznetsovii]
MNPVGLALRGLIRAYQLLVSPVLPASCRFTPSCSSYAMDAIHTHGPLGGSILAAKRLCRCHPWNDGGYDPVPEKTTCGDKARPYHHAG